MDSKYIFGRLLGEIYRIQKRVDPKTCNVGDDKIYGLIQGVEYVIDEELNNDVITIQETDTVAAILDEYFVDKTKLQAFQGFYDIEHTLENAGISRWKAIKIITLFYAEGRFTSLIDKMDTSKSPGECRTFKIPNWCK